MEVGREHMHPWRPESKTGWPVKVRRRGHSPVHKAGESAPRRGKTVFRGEGGTHHVVLYVSQKEGGEVRWGL